MPAGLSASAQAADLSDLELVDRLIRGSRGAFEQFYQRHNRLIFHCIRARADAADVNDLFQSFFERMIERDYHVLKLWQRGTSLPIYLSKVIRNFVIDFHRAKRKREDSVGGLAELEPLASGEDESMTSRLMLKELRKKGIEAWSKLDRRDRTLVAANFIAISAMRTWPSGSSFRPGRSAWRCLAPRPSCWRAYVLWCQNISRRRRNAMPAGYVFDHRGNPARRNAAPSKQWWGQR